MIYAPLNTEPEPLLQQIEIATFFQLPSFQLIGLPAPEVAEAKERVRSAMEASGFEFPKRRVVIGLSPSSIRKRGVGVDLAIALAVINGCGAQTERTVAWGELGLDGRVKPCGQLTRSLYAAWKEGISRFICSSDEFLEAGAALDRVRRGAAFSNPAPVLIPVKDLKEAQKKWIEKGETPSFSTGLPPNNPPAKELSETPVHLLPMHPQMERILGVAVCGFHHFILLGPKGVGKSHALEWALAIQPEMSASDQLFHELIREWGAGESKRESKRESQILGFRRVGVQTRAQALSGGVHQAVIFPGEFSLAHGGALIADELPEWSRDCREILREPLERGKITVNRVKRSFELPARFQLMANGNLCPCGGVPDRMLGLTLLSKQKVQRCRCKPVVQDSYLSRLSGPIADRLDIVFLLSEFPNFAKSASSVSTDRKGEGRGEGRGEGKGEGKGEGTQRLRILQTKVKETRKKLLKIYGSLPGVMSITDLEAWISKRPEHSASLDHLKYGSLRSRHKTMRVAMTLAAWDDAPIPTASHLIEASTYRPEKVLDPVF